MLNRTAALAAIVALSAGALGAEPDPAAYAPGDAVAFISVRDARSLLLPAAQLLSVMDAHATEVARVFLEGFHKVIAGRASVAVVMPPKAAPEEPAWVFRVPVDQSKVKVKDLLIKGITQALGEGNVKFTTQGGVGEIAGTRGGEKLYWAVHRGVFHLSNVRTYVAQVVHPPEGLVAHLAGQTKYRQLGKHVNWAGDVTAYVDLETAFWRKLTAKVEAARGLDGAGNMIWLYKWLAPDQFRAVGFSLKGDGATSSGRLALLTPKTRKGAAAFLNSANVPLPHLDRIPENVQILSASSSLTGGFVRRIARLMSDLDPDVATEFSNELAEFNKELGVDVDKDLFDNLGTMVSGARLPGGGGETTVFLLGAVRDKAKLQKCVAALAAYNKTPLRRHERGGRTYHILPMKPPMGYTFDGGLLLFSNTFEAAEEMLALKQGGKSLATSAAFARLRKRLPAKNMMVWAVDMKWASEMASTLLMLAPDLGKGSPVPMLRKVLGEFRKAEPGLSVGVALRNEPDAYVAHFESLAGGLSGLFRGLGAGLVQPLKNARRQSRRLQSQHRLEQIGHAVMMSMTANHGKLPPSLKALLDDEYLPDPKILLAPGSGSKPVKGKFVSDYDSLFDRAQAPLGPKIPPAALMMAWEKKPFTGPGRAVLFADGHVEWVPDAKFNRLLKKADEYIQKNKAKK